MNTNYLEKKNRNPLGDKDDKLLCRFKAWLQEKGRLAESTIKPILDDGAAFSDLATVKWNAFGGRG